MVRIILGCDNAAVSLKNEITAFLKSKGVDVEDMGVMDASDETPYPEVAARVAKRIIKSGYADKGILICGTGIGMAIAANKFPGIYAAQVHDVYSAERACLSNNANVITMGARVIGPELAKKLVEEWLPLEFIPGRSSSKLDAIRKIEKENFRNV
ncbi:ribose 5-phosphate isomerase B [Aminivibrio sp.]|jgi:ribose 5-phosphate isomerase B|uniref:ribose 5-phosphate isomerase B n=1 Tax=Aminivibrio sp. TaxID=1872489 RepID=UPI001A62F274|nr:ribose 5-phosphate isomerase B [Aminivibrio sp.]MBL3540434.1 ribose 5-phosphate isomerase B [Aminivibrio sp.]